MSKELSPEARKAMESNYPCQIDDETLRDGLQDPDVRQPTPEEALVLFDLMHQLGTHKADIGFANAGAIHRDNIRAIAEHNVGLEQPMEISCAARMRIGDIEPIVQISQETGAHLWADAFIGSDPDRIKVEGWTAEAMVSWVEEAVGYARENDVDVMMVTENTIAGIQKDSATVEQLYLAALNKGARRVCISDTTGNAYHREVEASVLWMKQLLDKNGFGDVGIDFHGHNDLASAVPNSVAALEAGAQRVHATILGVGERCGNTDRTTLQLQLRRLGMDQNAYNLKILPEYALEASRILGIPIPETYPGVGEKSRSVVAGVHANAILKAHQNLLHEEAGGVYLPINYGKVLGLKPSHVAKVGPMAGLSNVHLWAALRDMEISETQAQKVLEVAKTAGQSLTDETIMKLLN